MYTQEVIRLEHLTVERNMTACCEQHLARDDRYASFFYGLSQLVLWE
jgi:hypothetical protein